MMLDHLAQLPGFDMLQSRFEFGEADVEFMIQRYKPMFLKHWEEVAIYKDVRPLDPDWDAYIRCAQGGAIVCYGATDTAKGEIVAYSVYAIMHSLHYRTWVGATNDIYYVDPQHRRTSSAWLARDFFAAADAWLKDTYGVRSIRYPVKAHLDHSAVFKELGYAKVEDIYERLT